MTTNVFDIGAAVVASDSRWSYTLKENDVPFAVVYADDTNFDKMVVAEGACALFAGSSRLINDWKHWIAAPHKVALRRPAVVDDFAMCIVEAATGRLIFEHGQRISDATYRFAGTGARSAHTCWMSNRDAIRAVRSAADADQWSGGEVKYMKIKEQVHNVSSDSDFDSINEAILQRGMVMYKVYDGKVVSIQDAAKTDKRVANLMNHIKSGEAAAEAPNGHDPVIWTETDVKRLDAALEGFFGVFAK
jgi:hypothetical protein